MNEPKTIKYKIWTSNIGWEIVETCHWLADALRKSGIRQPYKVEFRSKRCWKEVAPHAVDLAIKKAWGITA